MNLICNARKNPAENHIKFGASLPLLVWPDGGVWIGSGTPETVALSEMASHEGTLLRTNISNQHGEINEFILILRKNITYY